jgi:hypothetical protein
VLLFVPMALLFALTWRQPSCALILRPFRYKKASRALRRLIRNELAGVGHFYTLSDRHLRLAWISRVPRPLQELGFFAFQHAVDSESSLNEASRRLSRTWLRTINWFYSRHKLFTIDCNAHFWGRTVELLANRVAIILVDLTGLHAAVIEEMQFVRKLRGMRSLICIVEEGELQPAKLFLSQNFPEENIPLVTYNLSGSSEPGALLRLVAEILVAA